MAYTTVTDIRLLSGYTTADISDADLTSLIPYATAIFNEAVNRHIREEKIENIDGVRENDIDGSNTTFYLKSGYDWFVADTTDSGTVTVADIAVYIEDTSVDPNTRTEATVSTLDDTIGKFVLVSAPVSGDVLTVDYAKSPVKESATADQLVKMAVSQLVSAYGATSLTAAQLGSFSIGDFRQSASTSASFNHFYNSYTNTLGLIRKRMPTIAKYK